MAIVQQIAFALLLAAASYLAFRNFSRIRRIILLGRDENRNDQKAKRWRTMLLVAIGQSKMVKRKTLAGVFHVFIYAGFLLVNVEVIEFIVDGLAGTHRFFAPYIGVLYDAMTAVAETFLVLVFISAVVFLARRTVVKVPRLSHSDLKGWPQLDANIILWTEVFLVLALVTLNATDQVLSARHGHSYGTFPVSQWFVPLFAGMSEGSLQIIERVAWWLHIIGIFAFLNYLPFSKHLHIMLAFPTVYYSQLSPKGQFPINETVKREVDLMLNPNATPPTADAQPATLGAKEITDLSWKNLLDAYSCTECGRCTSSCPANLTGKQLSPRRIMQMTRDRAHDYALNLQPDKSWKEDGKSLHDYISAEELWACTTCNACHDACPININPMDIIVQMRQYKVMEQSAAPEALNSMFMNTENSQSPWAFPAADRFNWASDVQMNERS